MAEEMYVIVEVSIPEDLAYKLARSGARGNRVEQNQVTASVSDSFDGDYPVPDDISLDDELASVVKNLVYLGVLE